MSYNKQYIAPAGEWWTRYTCYMSVLVKTGLVTVR